MSPRRAPLAALLAVTSVAAGALTCGLGAGDEANAVAALAVQGLGLEIFLGTLAFAGAVLSPENPMDRLGLRRGRLPVTQSLALIAGTLGASAMLDGALDVLQLKQFSAVWEFDRMIAGARGSDLLVAGLAFALAPAICEELLCRGLLQRGLVRRFGAPGGIAIASLAFGVLHLDPIHAAVAAILGLYLGVAFHLAGSLRTAIACHLVNNLAALLSAAFFPAVGGGLMAVGVGGAGAVAALWLVWRRSGFPPSGVSGTG